MAAPMESYFDVHDIPQSPRRNKRKRARWYDPNANKADLRYKEDYGL